MSVGVLTSLNQREARAMLSVVLAAAEAPGLPPAQAGNLRRAARKLAIASERGAQIDRKQRARMR